MTWCDFNEDIVFLFINKFNEKSNLFLNFQLDRKFFLDKRKICKNTAIKKKSAILIQFRNQLTFKCFATMMVPVLYHMSFLHIRLLSDFISQALSAKEIVFTFHWRSFQERIWKENDSTRQME